MPKADSSVPTDEGKDETVKRPPMNIGCRFGHYRKSHYVIEVLEVCAFVRRR